VAFVDVHTAGLYYTLADIEEGEITVAVNLGQGEATIED
jgi:hypothetical protein